MKPLAVDDPVTVLDETGKLLVQARYMGDGAHVYRYGTAGRVHMPNTVVRMADEGATWCRGHVTDKDAAGKALLVAAALAPEKPSAQDEAIVAAGSLIFLGMKYVFKKLREKRERDKTPDR